MASGVLARLSSLSPAPPDGTAHESPTMDAHPKRDVKIAPRHADPSSTARACNTCRPMARSSASPVAPQEMGYGERFGEHRLVQLVLGSMHRTERFAKVLAVRFSLPPNDFPERSAPTDVMSFQALPESSQLPPWVFGLTVYDIWK